MCMYICLVVQMKYMYEYHEQTNQNKYVASERLGGRDRTATYFLSKNIFLKFMLRKIIF